MLASTETCTGTDSCCETTAPPSRPPLSRDPAPPRSRGSAVPPSRDSPHRRTAVGEITTATASCRRSAGMCPASPLSCILKSTKESA
eukprot:363354-Chlamydomonas_euryale.AAC.8